VSGSGPSPAVVAIVRRRSGDSCERCTGRGEQIHHRCPRQMGGSKHTSWINDPSNLVHLCGDCHRVVESNRREAIADGWLIPRARADREHPSTIPIVDVFGQVWSIDDDGNFTPRGRI